MRLRRVYRLVRCGHIKNHVGFNQAKGRWGEELNVELYSLLRRDRRVVFHVRNPGNTSRGVVNFRARRQAWNKNASPGEGLRSRIRDFNNLVVKVGMSGWADRADHYQ